MECAEDPIDGREDDAKIAITSGVMDLVHTLQVAVESGALEPATGNRAVNATMDDLKPVKVKVHRSERDDRWDDCLEKPEADAEIEQRETKRDDGDNARVRIVVFVFVLALEFGLGMDLVMFDMVATCDAAVRMQKLGVDEPLGDAGAEEGEQKGSDSQKEVGNVEVEIMDHRVGMS